MCWFSRVHTRQTYHAGLGHFPLSQVHQKSHFQAVHNVPEFTETLPQQLRLVKQSAPPPPAPPLPPLLRAFREYRVLRVHQRRMSLSSWVLPTVLALVYQLLLCVVPQLQLRTLWSTMQPRGVHLFSCILRSLLHTQFGDRVISAEFSLLSLWALKGYGSAHNAGYRRRS